MLRSDQMQCQILNCSQFHPRSLLNSWTISVTQSIEDFAVSWMCFQAAMQFLMWFCIPAALAHSLPNRWFCFNITKQLTQLTWATPERASAAIRVGSAPQCAPIHRCPLQAQVVPVLPRWLVINRWFPWHDPFYLSSANLLKWLRELKTTFPYIPYHCKRCRWRSIKPRPSRVLETEFLLPWTCNGSSSSHGYFCQHERPSSHFCLFSFLESFDPHSFLSS